MMRPRFDQLLNPGHAVVMGLDHVRFRGAAGFDGVGINGSLAQNPMAVQKMAGAQDALLHGDELLADDVALGLGIAHARQRFEKFGFGFFDVKRRGAELLRTGAARRRSRPPASGRCRHRCR